MKLTFLKISLALLLLAAFALNSPGRGCATCGGGGAGSSEANVGISFHISVGKAQFGQSAGRLTFSSMVPDYSLSTPVVLQYDAPTRSDVVVVTTNEITTNIVPFYLSSNTLTITTNYTYTTSGGVTTTNVSYSGSIATTTTTVYSNYYTTNVVILQVQAPQAIADIPVPSSTNGYTINFYSPSQVTGQVNGSDQFSGNPFAIWTITNPVSSTPYQLLVSETNMITSSSKQWYYSYSGGVWSKYSPGGLIQKNSSLLMISNDFYQVFTTLQASNGAVVQSKSTIYHVFDWGTAPVQTIQGSNSVKITTYNYDDSSEYGNGSPPPLRSVINPDGSWQYTSSYDPTGNPVNVYSSVGDLPISSYSSGRQTYYDYSTGFIGGSGDDYTISTNTPRCVINYMADNEVSRRYTIFPSTNSRVDIQCVAPDADWNDPANLYTTNYFYASGSNVCALKLVVHPDKTMTTYDYTNSLGGAYRTNIMATGQPDPTFTYIVDGTTNYTVLDQFGNLVLSVTKDISTGIILSQDTYGNPDSYGRPQQVTHLDGTTEYTTYACCGLDSTTDKDGVVTQYYYDAAKRQIAYSRNSLTYSNVLDAAGRVLQSVRYGSDNSAIITAQTSYDLNDEILTTTNALNGVTTYGLSTNSTTGGLLRTITNPDGGVISNAYYADGTLKTVIGTAARPMAYVYGSDEGDQYTIAYKLDGSGGSNEWTQTYTDMMGRPMKTVYAASSGSPTSYTYYNILGQRTNDIDPDGVSKFYGYNAKGEQTVTMVDMPQSGSWNLGASNQITMRTNDVTTDYSKNVRRTQTYAWSTLSSSTPTLISTIETSADGLITWNKLWNAASAIVSSNVTVYAGSGYRYQTNVAADGSFMVNTYLYGLLQSSVRKDAAGTQISSLSYSYDAHNRQYQITDARTGTTSYTFNNADQITSVTTPSPTEVTSSYFDNMGRNWKTSLPDGTSQTNEFYLTGNLKRQYGSREYPVGYGYDSQGRMSKMTNWSSFASGTGGRVTSWAYNVYRGFLTNKTYDGSTAGPSYTYTAAGRLYQRTWARGITTTYAYDNAGGLLSASYSDSTPGVVYGYDRRGRKIVVTKGATDTTAFTYNDQNLALTETNNGGTLDSTGLAFSYDSLLRRTNCSVFYSGTLLTMGTNDFDAASRLNKVSDGTDSAAYSYLANSSLISQITFAHSGTTKMTTSKSYDNLNRLTSISSANASSVVLDSHNYVYNSANQRTSVTNADGTYWVYGYDSLGQVVSGIKYWPDGSAVTGQQFGYGFDDIGNRKTTSAGGDQWGANLRYASYSANNLNQYTSRTVPGAVDVIGSSVTNATVTVNNRATSRKGTYYRAELPLSNGSGPVWQSVSNLAVLNEGTNFVVETNISGNVYLPQTPESFAYDADGNLTNDGRWSYVWDAENRLVNMTSHSGGPASSKLKLDFVYDSKGRRIQKVVSTNGVSGYAEEYTNRFVYDGWNLLAILNPQSAIVESFLWGLDLSGSVQGAGGVGGLVNMAYYGPTTTNCFPTYDGNGNVTALANASDSSLVGQYEYGPFGEAIRSSGPMAKTNPFRFSTKYQDGESDLLDYGHRYYSPNLGRWLNRDIIGETGGLNLYSFVNDNSINAIDIFGLATWQRKNCLAVSIVFSESTYLIVGASIKGEIRGEICSCCFNGMTIPFDYAKISVNFKASAGFGFGADLELPVFGDVGWTMRGPQVSVSGGLSFGKDCGVSPVTVTGEFSTTVDYGGSFSIGGGFGARIEWWAKGGFTVSAALSMHSFSIKSKVGVNKGGQFTVIIPFVIDEVNIPFMLSDERDDGPGHTWTW